MAYNGYDDAWVLGGRNMAQSQSLRGNSRSRAPMYRRQNHHGEHPQDHHYYERHYHGQPSSYRHHLEHSGSHRHEGYSEGYRQEHLRSWSHSRPDHFIHGDRHRIPEYARLAWPTEIPVKLSVWICCDECKTIIYDGLRHLEGVHDVGISGCSNALVTVTGTAPANKILERAREVAEHAELWTDGGHARS